ncbi:MAG: response regulator [Candidatus Omnitrophica bacterium]|nr:response regulator [Candidatus Omnitrophota bacterium]
MTTPKTKILIVDDNIDNIDVLEELLEDDYFLGIAQSGEECLEKAHEFKEDIILLDVMMPGIDGHTVCQQLRENPDFLSTKILMISAKARSEEILKGYTSGADDYIVKPFEKNEVRAKIDVYSKIVNVEKSNKEKIEILTQLAQNLQDPLQEIKTYAQNLQENTSLEGTHKEYLTHIIEKANLLENLAKEIH